MLCQFCSRADCTWNFTEIIFTTLRPRCGSQIQARKKMAIIWHNCDSCQRLQYLHQHMTSTPSTSKPFPFQHFKNTAQQCVSWILCCFRGTESREFLPWAEMVSGARIMKFLGSDSEQMLHPTNFRQVFRNKHNEEKFRHLEREYQVMLLFSSLCQPVASRAV